MGGFATPNGIPNPYMGIVNYERHHVDISYSPKRSVDPSMSPFLRDAVR
jgi:hypothetical protein